MAIRSQQKENFKKEVEIITTKIGVINKNYYLIKNKM